MATWAIGDLQGCYDETARLIDKLQYDPVRDSLWFCGDLVNRGGQSLEVLRLIRSLGPQTIVTLGNHDLSLLAIAERTPAEQEKVNPELRSVLFAPDRDELLGWLRAQKLLHHDAALNFAMVHAGLAPRWTLEHAQRAAREVENQLRGTDYRRLLRSMFGNKPEVWSGRLRGIERQRASINVLTRLRYCDTRGRIAFGEKGTPGTQKPGLYPWFEVPTMQRREVRIVCGHWSTLGRFAGLGIYAIDTGCVWGGALTALRLDVEDPYFVSEKSTRQKPADKEMD
jgi:bis(5'-nucleosyl)-tetraphosphatase (symmetrical)